MMRVLDARGEESDEEELDFSPFGTPATALQKRDVEQFSSLGKLQPADLDFTELTRGNQMLKISKVDRRGITFDQLKKLLVFLKKRCNEQGVIRGWCDPRTGEQLYYRTINLKQLHYWIIKPVTEKRQCSYVEAVCKDEQAQRPAWFVAHSWTEPFVDFVRRAMKRGTLGAGDAFWSCPFSSRMEDCCESKPGDGPNVMDFRDLTSLKVQFSGITRTRNAEELQRNLPSVQSLASLDLNIRDGILLNSAVGLGTTLGAFRSLTTLRVNLSGCTALQSMDALCRSMHYLGNQLTVLELDVRLSGLKHLGGGSSSATAPGGCCLPGMRALKRLKVESQDCQSLASLDIVSEDMKMLTAIELNFSRCSSLTSLEALARPLCKLTTLSCLSLNLAGCASLRSLGDLQSSLENLRNLTDLQLDLSLCPGLDDTATHELASTLGRLPETCVQDVTFKGFERRSKDLTKVQL